MNLLSAEVTLPERPARASGARRVLHVCPYMHPAAGGPPVVVGRLATDAGSFGWEASVLTTSLMCNDDGRALGAGLGQSLDVEVLPIDRPRFLGHASRANAAMDLAVRNADIVHVHTLWHPLNTIARCTCKRLGKPYVLSPHGMLEPYSLSVHNWRKRLYLRFVERYNLEGASRIVFTTEMERDLSKPRMPCAAEDEIIPLGADQPPAVSFADLAEGFLGSHPGGIDGQRMIFLSRLHPKKNLECLFKAMQSVVAAHPGAHLFVVGSGRSTYEARLHLLAQELGLDSNLTFTGFLSGEAKWAAMAAADVFILPSHQENFGIAVAEAMHAALPIIVTRSVNLAGAIEKAGAGIVLDDPDDFGALAATIIRLIQNPVKLKQAGERARKLASAEYTWSEAVRRQCVAYGEVLAGR